MATSNCQHETLNFRDGVLADGLHSLQVGVTKLVQPGERNTIAIRVLNDAELGGPYRRGFFWSPKQEDE